MQPDDADGVAVRLAPARGADCSGYRVDAVQIEDISRTPVTGMWRRHDRTTARCRCCDHPRDRPVDVFRIDSRLLGWAGPRRIGRSTMAINALAQIHPQRPSIVLDVDRESRVPLYEQLRLQLRQAIFEG